MNKKLNFCLIIYYHCCFKCIVIQILWKTVRFCVYLTACEKPLHNMGARACASKENVEFIYVWGRKLRVDRVISGYLRENENELSIIIPNEIKSLLKKYSDDVIPRSKEQIEFENNAESTKVCLLGATAVGKTAIVIRLLHNTFIANYDPTIEDRYDHIMNVDNKMIKLAILDTAGI